MGQPEGLDPSAFTLEAGPVGVLLIHGIPGSPPEMRLIGEYLHQRGCTVQAPLLPGHGTTPEELNEGRWQDWIEHLRHELRLLRARCDTVFVGGLSGGAIMTLFLAATEPGIAGAITYSVAIAIANPLIRLVPIGKYLIRQFPLRPEHLTDPSAISRIWTYDTYPTFAVHELLKLTRQVKRLLPRITVPLLIVQSEIDRDVRPRSAWFVHDRAGSQDKRVVMLDNSGHAITVDSQWERAAAETYEFVRAHATASSPG